MPPTTRAGMQAQVVADRRAADPRAQQQRRRLERAAGDDDLRRAHRDLRRARPSGRLPDAPRRRPRGRSRPARASARRAGEEVGAPCSCASREPGPVGALLAAGLVAEAHVAPRSRASSVADRRCARSSRSSSRAPRRPPSCRCCGPFRSEQLSFAPIRSQTASRWRSKSGPSTPSSPCSRPLLAHPRAGAQAVGPVDRRCRRRGSCPATGVTLPSAVGVGPAAPVHLLVGRAARAGRSRTRCSSRPPRARRPSGRAAASDAGDHAAARRPSRRCRRRPRASPRALGLDASSSGFGDLRRRRDRARGSRTSPSSGSGPVSGSGAP